MQLVCYGAQDIFLTGNPSITYFKIVYRRHSNFSIESIQQTFSGHVGFGRTVTSLLTRDGDLLSGLLLEIQIPVLVDGQWVHDLGNYLVSRVDIEIGGQLIDRHYSDWLEIWSQLTVTASHRLGYNDMIGEGRVSSTGEYEGLQARGDHDIQKLMVPLQFWFCRNVGLSLPLIALQYHEIKLNITFANASDVIDNGVIDGDLTCSLYADYIYLDMDERRRFAQVAHEYLIEQVQFNGIEHYSGAGGSVSYPLQFNHPVKELIWTCQDASNMVPASLIFGGETTLIGGTRSDTARQIFVDENFIYICGTSLSTTLNNVDPQNPEPGTRKGFIAKLNKDYSFVWLKWFGTTENIVENIKPDSQGNVYCYGFTYTDGSITIDGQIYNLPITAGIGSQNSYVVKFNQTGTLIWFKWIYGRTENSITSFTNNIVRLNRCAFDDRHMYFSAITTSSVISMTGANDEVSYNFGVDGPVKGVVYKITHDGVVVWYGALTAMAPSECILTSDGFLAVSGHGTAQNTNFIIMDGATGIQIGATRTFSCLDVCVFKASVADATVQWVRCCSNSSSLSVSVAVDNNDNIIFCPLTPALNPLDNMIVTDEIGNVITILTGPPTNNIGALIKFDSMGNVIFGIWIGDRVRKIYNIISDLDNNIIVSFNDNRGPVFSAYDQKGELLYTKTGFTLSAIDFGVTQTLSTAIFDDRIYVYSIRTRLTNGLTVNNIVNNQTVNTERYTYAYDPAAPNLFFYSYRHNFSHSAPDAYSVGTSGTGADNFYPLTAGRNPVVSATLYINGIERFATRSGDYFNLMQTYRHHTCMPKSRGINVYSFALKPEEHQPSGTCNFSRVNHSQLRLTYAQDLTGGIMKIFATNYNILRIMNGMGGLVYSN